MVYAFSFDIFLNTDLGRNSMWLVDGNGKSERCGYMVGKYNVLKSNIKCIISHAPCYLYMQFIYYNYDSVHMLPCALYLCK